MVAKGGGGMRCSEQEEPDIEPGRRIFDDDGGVCGEQVRQLGINKQNHARLKGTNMLLRREARQESAVC